MFQYSMYPCMYVCVCLTLLCKFLLVHVLFSFQTTSYWTGPGSVCEGSDVTLQCVVVFIITDNTVVVQPNVWSRDEMPIEVTNTSGHFLIPNHNPTFNSTTGGFTDLVITNVTLEDDNTVYTCSATGTPIASSVVLNVTGNMCTCEHN